MRLEAFEPSSSCAKKDEEFRARIFFCFCALRTLLYRDFKTTVCTASSQVYHCEAAAISAYDQLEYPILFAGAVVDWVYHSRDIVFMFQYHLLSAVWTFSGAAKLLNVQSHGLAHAYPHAPQRDDNATMDKVSVIAYGPRARVRFIQPRSTRGRLGMRSRMLTMAANRKAGGDLSLPANASLPRPRASQGPSPPPLCSTAALERGGTTAWDELRFQVAQLVPPAAAAAAAH